MMTKSRAELLEIYAGLSSLAEKAEGSLIHRDLLETSVIVGVKLGLIKLADLEKVRNANQNPKIGKSQLDKRTPLETRPSDT